MFAHIKRTSVHQFINAVDTGLALLRCLLPLLKHVFEDTDFWFFVVQYRTLSVFLEHVVVMAYWTYFPALACME